jgi:hypothetical protein
MSLLRDAHTFWPQKLHDGVQVFCKVYKFYVYVWNRKLSPLVAQHANTAGYWGGTKTSCVLGLAKLALLVFFWAHKYLNRQATFIDRHGLSSLAFVWFGGPFRFIKVVLHTFYIARFFVCFIELNAWLHFYFPGVQPRFSIVFLRFMLFVFCNRQNAQI